MDITKSNWNKSTIKDILTSIESSEYISIDCELTGIDINSKNLFDSSEKRYLKYASTCNKYSIMQLGICIFERNKDLKEENQILCKPYNIYMFPVKSNRSLSLEISAIYFNANYNFDFNKWIKNGVHFINSSQEEAEKRSFIEKNLNNLKPNMIFLNKEEERTEYNDIRDQVKDLFERKDITMITVKRPGKYYIILYLIENLTEDERKNLYFEEGKVENKDVIFISKVGSKEEKESKYNSYIETELPRVIDEKKGVKIIVESILSRLKKGEVKVLGHNCILDFMFLYSHFIKDLSTEATGVEFIKFKSELRSLFPNVYDTKYVYDVLSKRKSLMNDKLQSSSLELLYKLVLDLNHKSSNDKRLRLTFKQNHSDSFSNRYEKEEGEAYHEAGFDAYVTGYVFIYFDLNYSEIVSECKGKFYALHSIYDCFDLYSERDAFQFKDEFIFFGIHMNKGYKINELKISSQVKSLEMSKKLNKQYKDLYSNSIVFIINAYDNDPVFEKFSMEIENMRYLSNDNDNDNHVNGNGKEERFRVYRSFDKLSESISKL